MHPHPVYTNTSAVNKTDHFCGFLQALTKSQLPYPFCPNLCYYCGISNLNNSSFISHLQVHCPVKVYNIKVHKADTRSSYCAIVWLSSDTVAQHSCSTQLPMWIIFRGKKRYNWQYTVTTHICAFPMSQSHLILKAKTHEATLFTKPAADMVKSPWK